MLPRLVVAYWTPAVSISHESATVMTDCTPSTTDADTTPSACGPIDRAEHDPLDARR